MKSPSANKISVSTTPLFFMTISGYIYFFMTFLMSLFSNESVEVCWEGGILGSVSYGFIAIRNFMENAHFENYNKK